MENNISQMGLQSIESNVVFSSEWTGQKGKMLPSGSVLFFDDSFQ